MKTNNSILPSSSRKDDVELLISASYLLCCNAVADSGARLY